MTLRKKIALFAVPGLLAVSAFTFAFLNAPANTITFDVNPSIELTTNRLDDVIEINPLNDDAEALLKDYSPIDRDLEDVVNDLVDRMILTGYISGGQDNLVMITVQDNQANEALVDRVNKMIAAYLENKQIEATVVNKKLDLAWDELNKDGISSGKLAVIETLMADDDRLSREELSEMKVSELVALAKALDLKPSTLFDAVLDDDDFDDDDFDLDDDFNLDDDSDLDDDWDDDDDDSVNDDDFEDDDSEDEADMNDDSDDDRNSVSNSSDSVSSASASVNVTVSDNVISSDRARAIALNRVNGDIIKLALDYDDDDRPAYEVEILSGSLKYEIEIDAVSGQILKVESESVLNDDDRNELNDDDDAVLDDSDDHDDRDDDDDHDDNDDDDDDHNNDDDYDDDDNNDSDRDDD